MPLMTLGRRRRRTSAALLFVLCLAAGGDFGNGGGIEAKGVKPTGTPNLGGTMVTEGGLVFAGGTHDSRFRAFNSRTGQELWVARLEARGHATPITYLGKKSGRQYVVIVAGAGGYFSREVSDALGAFSLP